MVSAKHKVRPRFFADNSILLWTRVLRTVTGTYLSNIGDSARLFTLTYMAVADAYITSWDSKRHWNFWRPITAIHEGDNDGNAQTAGEPAWQSLITTPSYPDYTSGANDNSGAVTTMLANFFETDEVTLSMTNNTPQWSRRRARTDGSRTRQRTSSTLAST
jgi:hypothetical protein